jgi:hypothetical protein
MMRDSSGIKKMHSKVLAANSWSERQPFQLQPNLTGPYPIIAYPIERMQYYANQVDC